MSKLLKRFLGLAAIGGAIGAIVYYLKKTDNSEDFLNEFDDEFDFDSNAENDREYVSLNNTPKADTASEDSKENENADTADNTEEQTEESKVEETKDEA